MNYFKQTSDKLYDRHLYKIVYLNNNKKIFDNYYDTIDEWNASNKDLVSHIEVLDNNRSNKSKKGFL